MNRTRPLRESAPAGIELDSMSDAALESLVANAQRILDKRAFSRREAEQEREAFIAKQHQQDWQERGTEPTDSHYEQSLTDQQRVGTYLESREAEGKLNDFEASLLDQLRRRGSLSDKQVAAIVKRLDKQDRKPRNDTVKVTEPGVYEHDGIIYVVKFNKERTGLYAKQIRELNSTRLTETGEVVEIEFDYAPGAVYKLDPSEKMPLERAKHYTLRYGRCIVCGRHLRKAESVERGIGPVCIKSFG